MHVEIKTALPEEVSLRESKDEEKEKDMKIIDMTDTEFELIVDKVFERMKNSMQEKGKQVVRETLKYYRVDLLTLESIDIKLKFGYNAGYFSQILERIRRKNE